MSHEAIRSNLNMPDNSSYRSIAKNTVIFGSVKIVEVLVNVVRVKIIAILLGPNGVGIQTLFNSTLSSLNQISSLGLFQSAVRDISQAQQNNNTAEISRIVRIVHRWIWAVGILGTLLCVLGSGLLSRFAFGNRDYAGQFALLSFALLFWALSCGNITVMQGRRQLKSLAHASLYGAILSLILTVPLYYFWGVQGIAPAIIVGYLSMYVINSYYVRKECIDRTEKIGFKETFQRGSRIVGLGIILMFSNFLMTLFTYVTNIFISNYGDLADVGFFQAAFAITYGNLVVLVAILTSDYYPRLAAVHTDRVQVNSIVNQQTELLSLIVAPIAILLIILAPVAVRLLYSAEFIVIVPMLRWMSLSLIFRIMWHSLSYIILAKGDKRTYFIFDALLGNGLNFIFNIAAYYLWGLQGLAISFLVGAVSMVILLNIVTGVKYGFKYTAEFWRLFLSLVVCCIAAYLSIQLFEGVLGYSLCICLLILTTYRSFYILDRKIGISDYIKAKLHQKR